MVTTTAAREITSSKEPPPRNFILDCDRIFVPVQILESEFYVPLKESRTWRSSREVFFSIAAFRKVAPNPIAIGEYKCSTRKQSRSNMAWDRRSAF